jgi:hypothetical protein
LAASQLSGARTRYLRYLCLFRSASNIFCLAVLAFDEHAAMSFPQTSPMHTDIISLRVLVVTPSATLRDLLRQAAGHASVPAEVMEADGVATAEPLIAQGSDLLLLDSGMSAA